MLTDHTGFYLDRVNPERRLMLATVLEAVRDALGNAAIQRPSERAQARREAIAWFKAGGPDFQSVCLLAGLDPEYTRRAALRFIAKGERLPRRPKPHRVGKSADLREAA